MWALLGTGFELTLIIEKPKCHCIPLVKVGAYEGQVINEVLIQVHLTVAPVGPLDLLCGYFPNSKMHNWDRHN